MRRNVSHFSYREQSERRVVNHRWPEEEEQNFPDGVAANSQQLVSTRKQVIMTCGSHITSHADRLSNSSDSHSQFLTTKSGPTGITGITIGF